MIVVVSSTVPPGTMTGLVKPTLESLSGLSVDSDLYLAYVPERIAPGKALQEFVESPRLVGVLVLKALWFALNYLRPCVRM
jgi:UDP-N-acetyl-D-mannosaminuronic acid dehydrogenase